MTFNEYEMIERLPTVAEHQLLWESVGWGEVDIQMTEASIAGSIYGVVAIYQGVTVGMGRIVGDGAMYFYIQDVAVMPEHQASGVGGRILDQLLAYIRTSPRSSGGAPFIGLFASEGKERFYEKYGFRDYSPGMTGMFMVMDK
ncbi:GNAT family N-acetyltransferase [Paenibacillus sp. YPG26]|uniref:GNAT family N-acetyltransferase n=1 Tax=Paenibacillus sp. YPG26 TaxID=2878915 RepID=UPI002041100D|nr:GNAT family N-acetyltransferase [Paenibacillus sp. YPG26]USB33961.1 GNAT family N-acetyltransferase [Paenibacillus sp. YPG26]